MNEGSVARRYARALLELAQEDGQAERVGQELADFVDTLSREGLFREVLINPGFSKEERKVLLSSVLGRSGYATVTCNFLMLLVDKSRIDQYQGIDREYRKGLDDALGRVRATVRSASALEGSTVSRLREQLCRVTGKQVILDAQQDPSLIGGLVTQVGGLVFDGSIRTQLDALRTRLLAEQAALA